LTTSNSSLRSDKMGKRKSLPKPADPSSENDSNDEEIDEEEAFNSDDERKYGSFFGKAKATKNNLDDDGDEEDTDDGDDETGSDDDDGSDEQDDGSASEPEDDDGGQYMLDLLDTMGNNDTNRQPKTDSSNTSTALAQAVAQHVKESQFSSSVIPQANLTLDSLMEGLEDTPGFGNVQRSMKRVAAGRTTSAPVARIRSDRTQRKLHYEAQSKDVSQWLETVQRNRRAETLDFRPQRLELGGVGDLLVSRFFEPTTDFEQQMHEALQAAGQEDDAAFMAAEVAALQDDLGANRVSMEEYKKRRSQLAKMRALMFYQEQKSHYINKIKSKKYRRIRKKQRERLRDAETEHLLEEDPDLERELEEKEEMERMKERMTLAHKNTSKWAKRILKRGKNVDVDTRRALSAQLQRGDDLLQRMKTRGEEDDDEEEDDLLASAKKVLADTEQDDSAVQGQGLFKLSFMQRGIERQRELARQEARQLLLDLEANEQLESGSNDDEGNSGDEARQRRPKARTASEKEMKLVLKEGGMVASSLVFGKSDTTQVTCGISIGLGLHIDGDRKAPTISEHSSTLEVSSSKTADAFTSFAVDTAFHAKPQQENKAMDGAIGKDESNPWLVVEEHPPLPTTMSKSIVNTKIQKGKRKAMVDIDRAIDLLSDDPRHAGDIANNDNTVENPSDRTKKITMLTQEELVARAFAGPAAERAEEEFAREKEEMVEREDPSRKKRRIEDKSESMGWGSWTGQGAPPPKPPRKLPKKLQPPELKLPARKRQDKVKPGVIISERRVKRLANQFMVAQIPYPYTSREEYERAMVGAIGREWNVTSSFKSLTRPEVITRAGKIIQPLSKKVKRQRPAAKF
jgi:U3 small nucleolar RNA-associated protein 14